MSKLICKYSGVTTLEGMAEFVQGRSLTRAQSPQKHQLQMQLATGLFPGHSNGLRGLWIM